MGRRGPTMGLLAVLVTVAVACAGSTTTGSAGPATPSPTEAPRSTPASALSPASIVDLTARLECPHRSGTPSAIAVLDVGGTRTVLHTGMADTSGTELNETTRFRIASITKPVVAALVLDAVERGELTFGDQVGDLVPGWCGPRQPSPCARSWTTRAVSSTS